MIRHHPADEELADFLENRLTQCDRERIMTHIASCDDCLKTVISAYESVKYRTKKEGGAGKINYYLVFAILSFTLSFALPRYFIQLLAATLLLGAKWVVDSKSTKMLVMIHEAWKNNGERGASEALRRFDLNVNNRHKKE